MGCQQNITLEIYSNDNYIKKVKINEMANLEELRELLNFQGINYYFED